MISVVCDDWIETSLKLYGVAFRKKALSYLIELSRYPQVEIISDIDVFHRDCRIDDGATFLEVLLTYPSWVEHGIVITEYKTAYTISFELTDERVLTYIFKGTSDYGHNIFDFCTSLFSKVRKSLKSR